MVLTSERRIGAMGIDRGVDFFDRTCNVPRAVKRVRRVDCNEQSLELQGAQPPGIECTYERRVRSKIRTPAIHVHGHFPPCRPYYAARHRSASTRHVSVAAEIAGLTTTACAAPSAVMAEIGEVSVQAAAFAD